MSSLRNAVKRITHKERAQPRARAHLGILEKHSDYKQRAVDYHRKQDKIKQLRQKAAQRNPDEFYFGMVNAKVDHRDGKHRKTAAATPADVGHETIRLLKDQDLSYIRWQKQKDLSKLEKMQANLHMMQQSGPPRDNNDDYDFAASQTQRKHTIFVDSAAQAQDFDVAQHFDTLPVLVHRSYHRPRVADLKDGTNHHDDDEEDEEEPFVPPTTAELRQQERKARGLAKKLAKAREGAYRELQQRQKRAQKLARAEAHLVTEKLVQGKGRKRKIQNANDEQGQPAVYKWRRQRLR